MANIAHYGFRPWTGNPFTGGRATPPSISRVVASAYQAQDDGSGFSVDLNVGDPVKLVNDGTVALANTTEAIFGVITGVAPYWDGEKMKPSSKLPGGTTWGTVEERKSIVMVTPVNACNWVITVDDATTATTEAAYRAFINENVTHVCVGNSTTAKANPQIDISLHATTASLVWRIVDVPPGQDFDQANVQIVVACNKSQDPGQAATTIAGV